ncbi:hypothetical protein NEMBOFW57_001493 [Staphylotrichum longicolle]|uniref:N-acetyltransferase domain-containing protein n=1 Tax=Staphylotrichum longicolle TaxID=669026 RepID=A0AAD4F266_9PEZI|nr:hypothetical protein NEMBOFW57_001493 [Staphylotrichum longicolle]
MASAASSAPAPSPSPSPSPSPAGPGLPKGYTLRTGYPPIPNYLHLRAASGLTPKTPAQAAPVAKNSWHGCYVTFTPNQSDAPTGESANTEIIVAMGRIIGDGGWYFHVADMAVLPEHQRKGLGDAVLKHLMQHIKENAPQDGTGAWG